MRGLHRRATKRGKHMGGRKKGEGEQKRKGKMKRMDTCGGKCPGGQGEGGVTSAKRKKNSGSRLNGRGKKE